MEGKNLEIGYGEPAVADTEAVDVDDDEIVAGPVRVVAGGWGKIQILGWNLAVVGRHYEHWPRDGVDAWQHPLMRHIHKSSLVTCNAYI